MIPLLQGHPYYATAAYAFVMALGSMPIKEWRRSWPLLIIIAIAISAGCPLVAYMGRSIAGVGP